MATNQDFNNLITRITKSTNELQVAVGVVTSAGGSVTQDAIDARNAAAQAKQSVIDVTSIVSGVSGDLQTINTAVARAEAEKLAATYQAQQASASSSEALTQANKAIKAVSDAKALAPFQEAPIDGSQYARRNATWVKVAASGSGGGVGTVTSVNGVSPDASGNVTISTGGGSSVVTVQADWNAVSGDSFIKNKPAIPTANTPVNKVINKRTGLPFESWIGTQAQYNSISSKDPNTRYDIIEV